MDIFSPPLIDVRIWLDPFFLNEFARLPFAFAIADDCTFYLTTPIIGVKVTISSSSSVVVFNLLGRGGSMLFCVRSSLLVFYVGSESLCVTCSGCI